MPMILHELFHFPILAEQDFDEDAEYKSIGIYSSRALAEAAIARLKHQPGFRDWPGGFRIFTRRLDQDTWVEGYINSGDT